MMLTPNAGLNSVNYTREEYKPSGASVIATKVEYLLTNSYAWVPVGVNPRRSR